MMPKVVLQILLYNEPQKEIARTIASLAAINYPRDRWRMVILSNFCDEHDTATLARSLADEHKNLLPEVTIIESKENLGFDGGHQTAYEEAMKWEPQYVYLLNGDAYVDPGVIREAVKYAQTHLNTSIVQSRIMLAQDTNLLNSQGNAMHYLGFGFSDGYKKTVHQARTQRLPMFYPSGAGVLIRTGSLKHRLFDPLYFMYHEDLDLGWRALLRGFDLGYAEDSVVYHNYEFSKSIQKFYFMERNRLLTNFANYKVASLALLAPIMVIMEIGTFIFAVKSGWWKQKLRAWVYFLKPSAWVWLVKRRREVGAFRKVPDREIFKFMVGKIEAQEVENKLLKHVVNPVLNFYFRFIKFIVRW